MSDCRNLYSATDQPTPVHNEKPAVWELVQTDFLQRFDASENKAVVNAVIDDMKARDDWGRSKYKTPLQPFNGRDALIDFYQELLDGSVYCRQYLWENPEENEYVSTGYEQVLTAICRLRELLLRRDGK